MPSPKVREAAETAIAAWIIDNISGNKWSYYQFGLVRCDRQLFSSLNFLIFSIKGQRPDMNLMFTCCIFDVDGSHVATFLELGASMKHRDHWRDGLTWWSADEFVIPFTLLARHFLGRSK